MSIANRHGWDTALDAQTDLLHSFGTIEGREYMNGFVNSLAQAGAFDTRTGLIAPPEQSSEYASKLVHSATTRLQLCEPFYVNDELTELIDLAAESFRFEPLLLSDLIVPNGFAYFDKPLYITDRRGLRMPFRALQWNPIISDDPGSGALIAFYADRRDPDPDGGYVDTKIGGSDLAMEYATGLRFGQDSPVYDDDASVRDMLAHVKVFFRFCQQQIAVPHHERVGRPVWKRAAHWKQIKEVIVFTLRRAKPGKYEGDEREVQWTHRWFVSGHWRNQPYVERDENGEKQIVYRQIYIAPFLKGPDDKPIIYKRRVFELVR